MKKLVAITLPDFSRKRQRGLILFLFGVGAVAFKKAARRPGIG